MKHLLTQFPSILAIYCFCLLQIPSSGFPRPLANPSDGLDVVKLEQLAYWATLSRQPKDNQDIYKRFLFHYSRTQEPTHPVKTEFPPVHPLMHLAAKLANRRMKRFRQRDAGTAAADFTKEDHTATLERPFFLFRPRNGRNLDFNTW
ncbi:neuromedin-S [Hippopotamus amphibius kiboko]|uniref:neuromedin-S n=1 Tax=Hippopotamus amphibius kiboko TaxID=575201 RepID=UPI00259815ED|nr:neuromedin-S [Hippopotamus amphibius kiboko]